MFIKPNRTPHDILSRYLPGGTGLLVHQQKYLHLNLNPPHQEKSFTFPISDKRWRKHFPYQDPMYKITNRTEFPMKEASEFLKLKDVV